MAKRKCKSKTRAHKPCPNAAGASGFCFVHDPARGKERAQARRRGGQRRRVAHAGDADSLPQKVRTPGDVLRILDYALAEALPLENSLPRGRLLIALADSFNESIKTGALEERLSALEKALAESAKHDS